MATKLEASEGDFNTAVQALLKEIASRRGSVHYKEDPADKTHGLVLTSVQRARGDDGRILTRIEKVEVWFPADTSFDPDPDPYEELPISLQAHRGVPADRRGAHVSER